MLYGVRFCSDAPDREERRGHIIRVSTDREELECWCEVVNHYGQTYYVKVAELPDIPPHIWIALLNVLNYLDDTGIANPLIDLNHQQLRVWLEPNSEAKP